MRLVFVREDGKKQSNIMFSRHPMLNEMDIYKPLVGMYNDVR